MNIAQTPTTEVISLRTAVKRRPGKKIAIFIGVVTTILILSYNLSKDIWFIYITDKEGILTLQNSEPTEIILGNPVTRRIIPQTVGRSSLIQIRCKI